MLFIYRCDDILSRHPAGRLLPFSPLYRPGCTLSPLTAKRVRAVSGSRGQGRYVFYQEMRFRHAHRRRNGKMLCLPQASRDQLLRRLRKAPVQLVPEVRHVGAGLRFDQHEGLLPVLRLLPVDRFVRLPRRMHLGKPAGRFHPHSRVSRPDGPSRLFAFLPAACDVNRPAGQACRTFG